MEDSEKLDRIIEAMDILANKVRALHQALAVHDDATAKRLNYVIGEMNVLAGYDDGHDMVSRHPPFSAEVHPSDFEGG